MPGLLSRFRRSPSTSSSASSESRRRRSSTASSGPIVYDDAAADHNRSATLGTSGSIFVENFDNNDGPRTAPSNSLSTPNHLKHKPPPLTVPSPGAKALVGTPKLVLTEEGSSSPRSFNSSPALNGSPSTEGVGLGLQPASSSEDMQTPTGHTNSYHTGPQNASMALSLGQPTTTESRDRSDSVTSASSQDGRHSRSGSIVSRIAAKVGHPSSPVTSTTSLTPAESRQTIAPKEEKKVRRRDRRRSTHSTMSGQSGIAAALAKSGLHIASPVGDDVIKSAQSKRSSRLRRSPFLTRRDAQDNDDEAVEDDEGHTLGDEQDDDEDYDDEEDDSDSDLGDDLPVTGFAVASNRRNADFHAQFPAVDEGDYLIEDYGCALSKDILVQGRLYVSENHICFHANIFGWVTDVVIPFSEIKTIEKKMTALVIPNAIGISTSSARYTFASFISRDTTYDVMMNIWRLCNPNAVMSSVSLSQATNAGSRPGSIVGDDADAGPKTGTGGGGHVATQCSCGRDGTHYSETALDTVFNSTPEKVFNLMFNSEWFKTFLSDNQKLRDIEYSDWRPIGADDKSLSRSTSYIKPLNGSIGPKQTKCHITDEREHFDLEDYIVMITTTRTPDVPSGGVFSVKTRTCLMWAGANSTKVIVTTTVEWTGKSWVKGIIEKSAIDGQKTYHDDLDAGMRAYMKEHASEFAGENGVEDVEAVEPDTEKAKETSPTEAQAYAARSRRDRQDTDLWSMQGGLDAIVSGTKAISSGIKGIFDALIDLLSSTPFRTESVMGIIILVLLVSNLWTYLARDTTSQAARRDRRIGTRSDDNDLADAVRLLLQKSDLSVRTQATELLNIIDQVETRAKLLRQGLEADIGVLSDVD